MVCISHVFVCLENSIYIQRFLWLINIPVHHHMNMIVYQMKISGRIYSAYILECSVVYIDMKHEMPWQFHHFKHLMFVLIIIFYIYLCSCCIQSPIRRSNESSEQLLTLPRVNSSLSSILTNEFSPSNSYCVSALSGDIPPSTTTNASNPKMAHLLYFLQTLENI